MVSKQSIPTIVLVGHCAADSSLLKSALSRVVPNAQFLRVNNDAGLASNRREAALWLVNRALDGDFRARDGIEMIADTLKTPGGPTCLLVSNHADAQRDAVAAGAQQGFGKSALYADSTVAALRNALGISAR